jgi:hypothetical protein
MSKWQPIKTAPKDGTPILVGLQDGEWSYDFGYWWAATASVMIAIWSPSYFAWLPPNGEAVPDYSGGYLTEAKPLDPAPTYWMPLPEPPGDSC